MLRRFLDPISDYFPIQPIVLIAVLGILIALFIVSPPHKAPPGKVISIEEGSSLLEIGDYLEVEGLIRSKTAFSLSARLLGVSHRIQAGDYLITNHESLLDLLYRMGRGEHNIDVVRIRVPEGASRKDMAKLFEEKLDLFDGGEFLLETKDEEGFLFPDTYFFFVNDKAPDVAERMRSAYETHMEEFRPLIEKASSTEREIIILASLIEKEASDRMDQKLISGVLHNRLEIGMPLQVDAAFVYLLGKGSHDLTDEDLKVDSPYNTYLYKGLPPGPIGSPGEASIEAALHPTPSEYFYYLSDSEGRTHFATTFEEHKENRRRYLQ